MLHPNLQDTEPSRSFCGEAKMYVAYFCLVHSKAITVCEVWFNRYVASSYEDEDDNGKYTQRSYFSPEQDINQDSAQL